jgi:DNA-binding transcriptional MerR regulator
MAMIELPEKAYFKIGEVAKLLEVEPYVLRYWETEFDVLDPEKTKSGQRVYQKDDIELLLQIRALLYEEMFTIAGARRQLERSRQGKTSYFDLQESPQGEGTAVAGDEELRVQLEAARSELVEVHQELEGTRGELVRVRETIGGGAELKELEQEIARLQHQVEAAEAAAHRTRAASIERDEQRRLRRERVLDSLEAQVHSLASVAQLDSYRHR